MIRFPRHAPAPQAPQEKMTHRRSFLRTLGAVGAAAFSARLPHAAELESLGTPQPFDFAWLKGRARALSAAPYQKPPGELPADIAGLDWDQYQSIRFQPDHALWADDHLRFKLQFFHLGLYFKRPVHLYEVTGGRARELAYDPAMFDYGKSGLQAHRQPKDLGFAGFRLNFHTAPRHDVVAFLGASYFRAVGGERQYGLSARGLAVDTGLPRDEEFPEFTEFYFERPAPESNTLVVYALLDSPSVAGAYRFAITTGETTLMDVDATLYPRKPIERLGIAPCTSMYQHGENDRRMANDWRPEIHDSDGLSMWRGNGEFIWRPLANPATLRYNSFADENPRGFGLLQRDRDFAHYQDDGAFYDKRPSLWVEPKHGWGTGSVVLIEIPTADETFDNIVAFWNPARKPQPGEELLFGYRLYWGAKAAVRPPLAHVVATRTGLGGIVGQKRKYFSWRFVVDFVGGDMALVDATAPVEPIITASRGRVEITSARPQKEIDGWRAAFDLVPDDSTEPITLRMYLSCDGQALSETWLYEWQPPGIQERELAVETGRPLVSG